MMRSVVAVFLASLFVVSCLAENTRRSCSTDYDCGSGHKCSRGHCENVLVVETVPLQSCVTCEAPAPPVVEPAIPVIPAQIQPVTPQPIVAEVVQPQPVTTIQPVTVEPVAIVGGISGSSAITPSVMGMALTLVGVLVAKRLF